jgi:hypothetical protein
VRLAAANGDRVRQNFDCILGFWHFERLGFLRKGFFESPVRRLDVFCKGKSAYLAHVTENSPGVFPSPPSISRRAAASPLSHVHGVYADSCGHRSTSYEITSSIERFQKCLVRLTKVALVTECRFVDSFCGLRQVFESSFPIGQTLF